MHSDKRNWGRGPDIVINFSGLSNSSLLGCALRLIPNAAEVRILQGPLRGKCWIAGSWNHGCWLGSYEAEKQRRIIQLVRQGMVCWDVGAHVGYYTLLFAELLRVAGKVFAFEPVPANLDLLGRHVLVNRCANVQILPCALADFDGRAEFAPGPNSSMGRIASGGSLTVPCRSADSLISSGEADVPDPIKLDVEGAEVAVLRGARCLLEGGRTTWFIATHGEREHRACLEILDEFRCEVQPLDRRSLERSFELMASPVRCET